MSARKIACPGACQLQLLKQRDACAASDDRTARFTLGLRYTRGQFDTVPLDGVKKRNTHKKPTVAIAPGAAERCTAPGRARVCVHTRIWWIQMVGSEAKRTMWGLRGTE